MIYGMNYGKLYQYMTQVYSGYLDEDSTYPYTVSGVIGLEIINTDASNALILTVTDIYGVSYDISVPASGTFIKNFKQLVTIDEHTSSASTSYVIWMGKGIED